ncbi:MAG TPA: 16S rRNA (uracil(1498)-N(3))-methyltransferase [Rhodocyclaceae bacterium]|nr:16S rRNA (uracil(1498)-N(3))-methyltransferase [Rhodocyclaceae bacterium]
MIPRFYCPDLAATVGATIALPDAAAHHAGRVLRLKAGEQVTLFDGVGHEWEGQLASVGKEVTVEIQSAAAGVAEPILKITLVQSLPSGDKMDWVVQKAVELGVTSIQPVAAKRSVVKLSGERAVKRITHWQEVAVSACEQSRRNVVPQVLPLLDLNQYFAQTRNSEEQRFLLAPTGGERLREMAMPGNSIALLIGPEGGFDDSEEAAARSVGFKPLLLGPRILRTETAGLATIAAMMALWGDI